MKIDHDFQQTCNSNIKPVSPIYKTITKGENERQAKRGWIIDPSSRKYPCCKLLRKESGNFHYKESTLDIGDEYTLLLQNAIIML